MKKKRFKDFNNYNNYKVPGRISFLSLSFFTIIGAISLFLLFFPLFNSYRLYKKSDPDAQINEYVGKIGKLIDLPSGEIPKVAIILKIQNLKGQPFYSGARNGDVVLFYAKAQKAILYDPKLNRIIKIGSYLDNSEMTISPAPQPSPKQYLFIKRLPSPSP